MLKNLPFDYIHDCLMSYGYLLLPIPFKKDRWGNTRWIGLFRDFQLRTQKFDGKRKICLTDYNGFHNCTVSGVR